MTDSTDNGDGSGRSERSPGAPLLSIIIAVHNGESVLPECLAALAASDLPRSEWELIVVDDASTDGSVPIAAEHADVVVRLPGKAKGPAYARNRGFEVSRAPILMFCDADVRVHPDVLSCFTSFFRKMPWVSAVFGSYDADPPAPGIVSQFRNLLHHYVHQSNPGEAETFWAGCGAIRREALVDVQLFDEWHYSRPEIEDIDMGRRLRRAGHRIVLRPEIQCTHLKHWTLGHVLHTDYNRRGVPWMRALLQEGTLVEFHALNLRYKERFCTAIALLATVSAVAAAITGSWLLLGAAAAMVLTVILLNLRFYGFLWQVRGARQAIASIPLHFIFYNTAALAGLQGYLTHILFGEPSASPEVEAEAALGLQFWPPCPRRPDDHLWRPIAVPQRRVER
ncbi:MAG TPA: glycosyltransferase family 2 protein [Longimicrobiales bacterium]|nr:glycosyltransferase family 2 protein [Longimicrobiales bacterium]